MKQTFAPRALVLALPLALTACAPPDDSPPPVKPAPATTQTAPERVVTEGPAQLVFDQDQVDLGRVSDEGTYTGRFPYYNAGSETLEIREVNGGCKCVTATVDKTSLAPGEEGVLTAVLKPKRQDGVKPRVITLLSNTPGERTQVTLTAEIEPLLMRSPSRILWGQKMPGAEADFRVELAFRDPELEFQPVRGPSWLKPWIERTSGPDENGLYHAVLSLTAENGMPWGVHEGGGALRLKIPVRATAEGANSPVRTDYELILMGKALGEIEPEVLVGKYKGRKDSRIDAGIVPAGKNYEYRLRLERQAGPLQVTGSKVSSMTDPGVMVRTEPYGLNAVDVVVFGKAPTQQNKSLKGNVVVSTALPGYEELTIGFQGVVR